MKRKQYNNTVRAIECKQQVLPLYLRRMTAVKFYVFEAVGHEKQMLKTSPIVILILPI